METKTTTQKLTAQETETLKSFIGKAVLDNVAFPSQTPGFDKITVQELLHNKTSEQLKEYGKFIEKSFASKNSSFDEDNTVKNWGSITALELISFLKLAIQNIKYTKEAAARERKLLQLKTKLETLKTPEELKAELEAQIAEIEN